MKRDLTEGSIFKNILFMSIPTMLGFAAQNFYDIVDMFWIGKISTEALAATTIFGTIFWTAGILNEIIGTSSISLISRSYGEKNIDRTRECIEQTIIFKFLVALVAGSLLALFLEPLIGFFTTSSRVVTLAIDYGRIRFLTLPFLFSSFTVNTALRCIGDSKKPMYIMIASSIMNIVLDPILMFDVIPYTTIKGFGMGISGAAYATIISQLFAFVVGMYILLSGRSNVKIRFNKLFTFIWDIDLKLITIGLPSGIDGLLRHFSSLIVMKFVSIFGDNVVAAFGVTGRITGFMFMPLVGLSMGTGAIVGQCIGADRLDRAKESAIASAKAGTGIMIAVMAIVMVIAKDVMLVFSQDPEVIAIGVDILRISVLGLVFAGGYMGLGSVFSGSGYNQPMMIASVISNWLVQIPLLIIFFKIFSFPLLFLWITFIITQGAQFIATYYYFKQGRWLLQRVY